MRFRNITLFLIGTALSLYAVTPRTVTYDFKTDFERGTLKNIAILSDGALKPAPMKTLLIDTGEPFVWCMAEDTKGNLYLGTGNEGKLFKITAGGDTSLVMDADELGFFALAVDANNNVYAATSPNGKVYKIDPSGKSSLFFDPDAVYIWDLDIDAGNNLLVATGEKAFIYSLTAKGESSVLFQGQENHVRTVVVHTDGVLYAGTSAQGYVYRIRPNQKPFVIFDPQMEEVNGLVVGENGSIYAAAFGQSLTMPPPQPTQQEESTQEENESTGEDNQDNSALTAQTIDIESLMRSRSAPSSLFVISPEGYARDLWLGVDEKIQSILAFGQDEILVGSGKSGKLLSLNMQGELSILLENDESHITSMLKNAKGQIVFCTSNLGRAYRLESARVDTALFISETIDAGLAALWGTIVWEGNETALSTIFHTRSGNTEQPSTTWSDWQPAEKDGDVLRISSPTARFIQWKCELKNQESRIDKVSLSYMQKNLAPTVSSIIIHRPNDYYETKPNNTNGFMAKGITFPAPLPNKQSKKGYRTIDWLFEDANFDGLSFDIYYRMTGSSLWRKLVENLDINIHSWDSMQMADGQYEIKIVARDKLNNPESLALCGEKVSPPFVIDNSGPRIKAEFNVKGKVWRAEITDEWNPLQKVEYSLDAQEWRVVYPTDGILDSKSELVEIESPDAQDHDLAIKASDSCENVSVFYITTK